LSGPTHHAGRVDSEENVARFRRGGVGPEADAARGGCAGLVGTGELVDLGSLCGGEDVDVAVAPRSRDKLAVGRVADAKDLVPRRCLLRRIVVDRGLCLLADHEDGLEQLEQRGLGDGRAVGRLVLLGLGRNRTCTPAQTRRATSPRHAPRNAALSTAAAPHAHAAPALGPPKL
jgi:hypothetical protein